MVRVAVVLFAILLAVTVARAQGDTAPRGSVDQAKRVLAVVASEGSFRLLDATPDQYTYGLADDSNRTAGVLQLRIGESDRMPRFRSRSFAMEVWSFVPSPAMVDPLVHAAHRVAESDGGALPDQPVRIAQGPLGDVRDATLVVVAAAVLLGVLRRGRVSWGLRLPHLLPAAIQLALFVYWSLYWPAVGGHASSIALQIAMGFAADAAFSFARFGSWRISAAPLPMVLSTNLFAWFNPAGIVISILAAFASKVLIRRGESHVLNPSAIGLSVGGVVALLAPDLVSFGGVFHTMNLAPNMAELIIVLALVPQARFRILPVSIGAVLALRAADNPAIGRSAMLLTVAVLATDPATIPRTDSGKLLFGGFVGLAIPLTSYALRHAGQVDDFAKVLPIPVANMLAPRFDELGAKAASRVRRILRAGARPVPNVVFVACWLALVVPLLWAEKPRSFEPALHWNLGTPLVVRDADDVPRCASNPVFCRPFTVVQEIALWRARSKVDPP